MVNGKSRSTGKTKKVDGAEKEEEAGLPVNLTGLRKKKGSYQEIKEADGKRFTSHPGRVGGVWLYLQKIE